MMGGMGGMGGMGSGGGFGGFGGLSGFGMGLGGLTMILLLVAVVFLLFWFFKHTADRDAERARGGGDRALEILKERFARGEIGEQEFASKRQALG